MSLGAVLASALNDASAHPKTLTVGGTDLMGRSGATYGTDPKTIKVTEAGPGQVSALTFVTTDPNGALTLSTGLTVIFWDNVKDLPIFRGFVESVRVVRYGLGSIFTITCVGVEAVLDWMYVPAFTIPTGTDATAGMQMIPSMAIGIGVPLTTAATTSGGSAFFSFVGSPMTATIGGANTVACTINGGTLRQALLQYGAFLRTQSPGLRNQPYVDAISVDFWLGLRMFGWNQTAGTTGATDLGLITLRSDSSPFPSETRYGLDSTGTVRAVYVIGTGISGVVGDGSGVPGVTASINDPNAVDVATLGQIGNGYLGDNRASVAGTVTWEGASLNTFASQRRAGGFLDLLDAQVDLPTLTRFPVLQIAKTFAASGEEAWTITFGKEQVGIAKLSRRLTRSTLS